MRFQDKVALITAAASGIGRATADIMAREGAIIVAVDNNEERLDRTVTELREAGGQAHGRLCDALDRAQVDRTVASVAQEFGAIDILVNAVGGSTIIAKPGADVDELDFADWQKLIDFNLSGTFLFTHAVVPIMKSQRRGKIVNLASIAGRGLSASSSSAMLRGGIIAFTRKLAELLARSASTSTRSSRAAPPTERISRVKPAEPGGPAGRDRPHPLRRVAEAVDQAKVICFLARTTPIS
jgi:NAD(P)-dependent dehydrogenase (short-subunit alcohol dehydrogenase family)